MRKLYPELPLFLIILALVWFTSDAEAATPCEEWATMSQVLVLRWQGDPQFQGKTAGDVKDRLRMDMSGNPEIKTAMGYVDYAYENRKKSPIEVWKGAFARCQAANSI